MRLQPVTFMIGTSIKLKLDPCRNG